MKKTLFFVFGVWTAVCVTATFPAFPAAPADRLAPAGDQNLLIVWTTGEKDVFTKMIGPYLSVAAKSWTIRTLLIWGPSERLTAEDADVQGLIRELKSAGVILKACKWCAEQYGVGQKLATMGFEVNYMGTPLTEALQSGQKLVTF